MNRLHALFLSLSGRMQHFMYFRDPSKTTNLSALIDSTYAKVGPVEDLHGPCARMTHRSMKRSVFCAVPQQASSYPLISSEEI